LQGDYLVYGSAEARLDQQGVSSFPRVQIEIWTFDGVSSVSGVLTVNSGGNVMVDVPTSRTYTVNPDLCAAPVTFMSRAQREVFITRDGTKGPASEWIPIQTARPSLRIGTSRSGAVGNTPTRRDEWFEAASVPKVNES
jgi:hypothetical protein